MDSHNFSLSILQCGIILVFCRSIAAQIQDGDVLPEVVVHFPSFDYARSPDSPDAHPGGGGMDDLLRNSFPGQFFSAEEITKINEKFGSHRSKRAIDKDLCCKTEVWFGTAPAKMTDAMKDEQWEILRGSDMFQAFSRGECYKEDPHHWCPDGGGCLQKFRMHTLWVSSEGAAAMKYFRVPSHCAYEKK